jgi:hypothetical protein
MGSCVGKCWCSCCHLPNSSCCLFNSSHSSISSRFIHDDRRIIASTESTSSSTIGLCEPISPINQQQRLPGVRDFLYDIFFRRSNNPSTSKRSVCFAGKSSSSLRKSQSRRRSSRKTSCNIIPCTANSLSLRKRSGSDSSIEFEHLVYDSFDIPVRITLTNASENNRCLCVKDNFKRYPIMGCSCSISASESFFIFLLYIIMRNTCSYAYCVSSWILT